VSDEDTLSEALSCMQGNLPSSLGGAVDCYCVDKIRIGQNVTISQYTFLCTATHDYESPHMPLVTGPIVIGDDAWVCADVIVGPGVRIGAGAVLPLQRRVSRAATRT
jgi:putative colanic acid biosynthesis acetyltransferase WcaF